MEIEAEMKYQFLQPESCHEDQHLDTLSFTLYFSHNFVGGWMSVGSWKTK